MKTGRQRTDWKVWLLLGWSTAVTVKELEFKDEGTRRDWLAPMHELNLDFVEARRNLILTTSLPSHMLGILFENLHEAGEKNAVAGKRNANTAGYLHL